MNAADVLADFISEYWDTSNLLPEDVDSLLAALLAHGEQGKGVTIEADGDLHPKDPPLTLTEDERKLVEDVRAWPRMTLSPGGRVVQIPDPSEAALLAIIDRLVPVSAEAGDTDGGLAKDKLPDVLDAVYTLLMDDDATRQEKAEAAAFLTSAYEDRALSAEAGDTEPSARLMEAVRSFLNDPVPKGTSLDTVQCNAAAVDELRAAYSAEAGDTDG